VLLAPNLLLADDEWRDWPLGDRLNLSIGGYFPDLDSEATVSEVDGLQGTPINFEDDLGLDDSDTAIFAALNWRFFKRHALNLNYYNLDRDAVATTSDVIVFDGIVFPAGIETDTEFNINVYELSYSYSLLFDAKKNLYLGFGVSAQDLEFGIASTQIPALSADEDFIAPLPTLNVGFEYALSDKWLLGLKLGYMDIDVDFGDDSFDAKILIGDAGVRWKAFNNLGLSLSYSLFHLDGEYEDDDIVAELDLDYKGPKASIDFYF